MWDFTSYISAKNRVLSTIWYLLSHVHRPENHALPLCSCSLVAEKATPHAHATVERKCVDHINNTKSRASEPHAHKSFLDRERNIDGEMEMGAMNSDTDLIFEQPNMTPHGGLQPNTTVASEERPAESLNLQLVYWGLGSLVILVFCYLTRSSIPDPSQRIALTARARAMARQQRQAEAERNPEKRKRLIDRALITKVSCELIATSVQCVVSDSHFICCSFLGSGRA